MTKLINGAQDDQNIKVILLHGGKYYSSGNDLTALMNAGADPENIRKYGKAGIFDNMNPFLRAINDSIKPVVAVVRGGSMGIGFTTLSLVDFLYVSPDAWFMTPFMRTFQSPEGTSTINFPNMMGKRMAAEVLLLDKTMTAKEAVACGFANREVAELVNEPEWFDINKIPEIATLLATDYGTLVNCKKLMNAAKDKKSFEAALEVEGHGLLNSWLMPSFPENIVGYMMRLAVEKKQRAKL
jgi:enoyl-CoA hydratase/carnithine racemase